MNESPNFPKRHPLAVWSLLLGIFSFFCLGPFTGIPAVICGHIARSKIKQSDGRETGRGMAIAGLSTGYIGTVLTIILAAIAIPNFLSYRNLSTCLQVEAQAKMVSASLACYLSYPSHDAIPTIEELTNSAECGFTPSDKVTIQISGPRDNIKITAYDNSGKCRFGSNYVISIPKSNHDGWQ